MEDNIPKVTDQVPSRGVAVSSYLKVHFQFWSIFLQAQEEVIFLEDIFQSEHVKFLDVLDNLQHDPSAVKDGKVTATPTSTSSIIPKGAYFLN